MVQVTDDFSGDLDYSPNLGIFLKDFFIIALVSSMGGVWPRKFCALLLFHHFSC